MEMTLQNNQGLGGQFVKSQLGAFFKEIWKKVYIQPYKN